MLVMAKLSTGSDGPLHLAITYAAQSANCFFGGTYCTHGSHVRFPLETESFWISISEPHSLGRTITNESRRPIRFLIGKLYVPGGLWLTNDEEWSDQ